MTDKTESWHLTKSVPVSIIVLILTQAIGFSYYISKIESKIEANVTAIVLTDKAIEKNSDRIREQGTKSNIQAIQLGRIEENLKSIKDTLDGIDERLRKD